MGQVHFFDLCQAIVLEAAFDASTYARPNIVEPVVRAAWLEAMAIDGARLVLEAKVRYLIAFGRAA